MGIFLSKVTSKGQITLPKQLREKLLIRNGDYLEMEMRGRELILRAASSRSDSLLLREYAAPYTPDAVDLQDLRKRFSGLPVSITDEIRAVRDGES